MRIIVPVRNLGRRIMPCLESILAQDYANLRLTLIDDRSEDDTYAWLARIAATDPRVKVHHVETLPAGWLGKSHALWAASKIAGEEWLLFIDDDCHLDPGAVRTTVRYAAAHDLDLLTLWPRHLAGSFWEHAVIPLCGAIIALWFMPRRANDAAGSPAFVNGQFLLIRRAAYERVGGHACVRDAIIEDVPFAEHAKRCGLRGRVASGAELFGVRMYDRYAAICDGWTRIYIGALRSGAKLALSMAWLAFGSLWPFVAATASLALLAWPGGVSPQVRTHLPAVLAMAALHILLVMVVSYRFWGYGRCSRRYLWLYPVSAVVVLGILVRAWWGLKVTRTIVWRQTRYRIDAEARIVPG